MKMEVVLTKKEFEAAILAALHVYEKAEINSLYLRADGGIECTVRTVEEKPVHSSRNSTDSCTAAPGRMELWMPDPAPFIHTVEAAPPEPAPEPVESRPHIGWYPASVDITGQKPVRCKCGSGFAVYKSQGWSENGRLHGVDVCEEEEAPAISAAAALSASSTGEHGTVEGVGEDDIPF